MNEKCIEFLENYQKHYKEVPHYMEPENPICIIVNCCNSKDNIKTKTEAINRYAGEDFNMLRTLKFGDINHPEYKRDKFDLYILSAQYGLIPYTALIDKYNITFNNLTDTELEEISSQLNIRNDIDKVLSKYKQVFILLGDKYRKTLNLKIPFNTEAELVYFELDKNVGTLNAIKSSKIYPIKFTEDLVKIFKTVLINVKMKTIFSLFQAYPNYDFIDNSSLINLFIESKRNTKKISIWDK